MMQKILISIFTIFMIAVVLLAQQAVEVRKITAPATGTKTAANSDSVVCATDTGCISGVAGGVVTNNSTTYSGKIAPDTNLLGTLGTAFTTAGLVDIKGTDGNVFVRQTTAANLNMTGVGTLAADGAAAGTNRFGTLPAIANSTYAAGTAYTAARNEAATVGTDGLLWTANLPAIRPASYSASKNFAASSTTDNSCIPGNATTDLLVYQLKVSGTQTTAGIVNVSVIKRSAADTGGTSANFTVVPDWAGLAAASSTPVSYTGTGPTAGAAVGDIDDQYTGFMAPATASPDDVYIGDWKMKPILLHGTAQTLCVNLGNAALTGGNLSVLWKWLEITPVTP